MKDSITINMRGQYDGNICRAIQDVSGKEPVMVNIGKSKENYITFDNSEEPYTLVISREQKTPLNTTVIATSRSDNVAQGLVSKFEESTGIKLSAESDETREILGQLIGLMSYEVLRDNPEKSLEILQRLAKNRSAQ